MEDWAVGVETGEVFLGPPCLCLHNVPMHCGQSGGYVEKWTSFFSNWFVSLEILSRPASNSSEFQ